MVYKTYENIDLRVMYEKNILTNFYDGKILFTDREPIKFFSLDEKELNVVLSGFEILNNRRFGRV